MAESTSSTKRLAKPKQSHHQLDQELRRPDRLHRWASQAYEVARKRLPQIAAAVLGIAVVGVAASVYSHFASGRNAKATEALAQVQKLSIAPLQLDANAPKPAADESDAVPRFKTDRERSEATLKALDELLSSYGSSGVADAAQLMRGGVLLELARFPEAATVYTALSRSSDDDVELMAREGLVYALEGKGDKVGALAEARTLGEKATKGPGFFRDRALFHEARLLQEQGDRRAALAAFKQLLEKYPASQLRDEAQDRVAVLDVK